MTSTKPTILTGLRANNDLHIGNYFGALLPIVDIAKQKAQDFNINLFMPDLHSITTPVDHAALQAQILHNLRLFVAAGLPLDDDSVRIYRQSYVAAHSELAWILDCFTGFGEMNRMTQFKDKSAKLGDERISVGLFAYPVLMAADILLYDTRYVPVGEDQSQHLEFARDIAQRINGRFGDIFTVPEAVQKQHEFFGKEQGLRIKDLQDPTKKMSKSDESGKGIIFLGDEPAAAAKKIMSAATDSVGVIHYDPANQPGISNLLQISALLTGNSLQNCIRQWDGTSSYGDLKSTVAQQVEHFLGEFQDRLDTVDDEALQAKLEHDEAAMNGTANATLLRVQKAVGLRP